MNEPRAEWAAAELVAMLAAYDESRRQREAAGDPSTIRAMTGDDIVRAAQRPRWQERLDAVKTDPVRTVLKAHAREIGWRLYASGGLAAMERTLDLVDDATPGRPGGAILDKWWDGLGVAGRGGVWCA